MSEEARRLVEAMLAAEGAWPQGEHGRRLLIGFPTKAAADEARAALIAVVSPALAGLSPDEEAMLREPSPL